MINFVRHFNHVLSNKIHTIILFGLLIFAVILKVWGFDGIFGFITSILPISMVIVAVLWLLREHKDFAARLILFLMIFSDQVGGMFRFLFSFNLKTFGFTQSFTWQLLLGFLGSLYLILYIFSYVMEKRVSVEYRKSIVVMPLMIACIYFYFRFGFSTTLLFIMPSIIALLLGSSVAAIFLLISYFIAVPFQAIDMLINVGLSNLPVSYWIFTIAAFYVLYASFRVAHQLIITIDPKQPNLDQNDLP